MIRPARCPHCGTQPDFADSPTSPGKVPVEGDVNICWHCRKPAIFHEVEGFLFLRRPNEAEQRELDEDPGFRDLMVRLQAPLSRAEMWDTVSEWVHDE